MVQGTFGMVQGTFGMVQGTFGMVQGTFGMVQGTFGNIQGTYLEPPPPPPKKVTCSAVSRVWLRSFHSGVSNTSLISSTARVCQDIKGTGVIQPTRDSAKIKSIKNKK
jgi:hypothetical protein